MTDRRLYQRFTADVMDIHGKIIYAKVVQMLDISIGGALLKTDKRLHPEKECILKIKDKGWILNIKSLVAWSSSDESIQMPKGYLVTSFRTGLKFMHDSKEKIKEIGDFIETHKQEVDKQVYGSILSGLRLHVRFKIEPPENTMLFFRQDYKIKNLGLGGMLIESDDSLDIGSKLYMEIFRSESKTIKVSGRVASCSLIKESDRERFAIGIEFLDIPEKDREMLKEIICLLENMGFIAF